jgi:hypothetical protein
VKIAERNLNLLSEMSYLGVILKLCEDIRIYELEFKVPVA